MFSATMRLDEETVDKERREQFVDSILVVRARNIQFGTPVHFSVPVILRNDIHTLCTRRWAPALDID